MAERVYPSAKPAANGGESNAVPVANGGANPTFPANKAQLYNTTRPMYRPQPPPRRRHKRGFCCRCCLWTTLLILLILLLAAIAGAVFWVIYRPHRPSFAVSTLHLSRFNLTNTAIISSFNITVVARNPNKKISFFYDPISVKVFSGDFTIADGSIPGFIHGKKNITVLKSVISSTNQIQEGTYVSPLKSSLKKNNLPLKIQLDTKVKAKIGNTKSKKIGVRVTCEGIKISVPTGKAATAAKTTGVKCKVDPRIKIIRWTV